MRCHFWSFRSRVIGRSWLSRSSDPRFSANFAALTWHLQESSIVWFRVMGVNPNQTMGGQLRSIAALTWHLQESSFVWFRVMGVNPNQTMGGHRVVFIGPPPALKVMQVQKKLMADGGGGGGGVGVATLTLFFPTSKSLGQFQFSRHE